MKDPMPSRPLTINGLLILLVLLAAGAFLGGGAFLLAPDGHLIQMPMSQLEKSPFTSFFIPGLLLVIFLGIYPTTVAYSLWKRPSWRWPDRINPFRQFHWGWAASLSVGVITIVWIGVEVIWVPFGLVHALFFVWGAVLVSLTLQPNVRRYCKRLL